VFEIEDGRLEIGSRTLLEDFEFWLERGEHVSLVGPNGSGKTTLITALAGQRELDAGKLRRGGTTIKLGLLSQHAEELGSSGTVVEATQRATGLTPNNARALLGRFLFSGEDAEKPLDGLSGGERRRLSAGDPRALRFQRPDPRRADEPPRPGEPRGARGGAAELPGRAACSSRTTERFWMLSVPATIAVEDQTLHSYVGGWPEYLRVREERAEARRRPKRARPAALSEARVLSRPCRRTKPLGRSGSRLRSRRPRRL